MINKKVFLVIKNLAQKTKKQLNHIKKQKNGKIFKLF